MNTTARTTLTALLLALGTSAAIPASADSGATVSTAEGHLVDQNGMSLYLFEPDEQGASTCYDACAEARPPLVAENQPTAAGDAKASLLGTTERKDGSMQVTYGGWPLYYFVQDQNPGDIKGQDKHGFGGEWYLVTPEGNQKE